MRVANVALGNSTIKPDWCRLRDWLERRGPQFVALQKIGPGEPSLEEELCKIGYMGWFLHHKRNYLGKV